jgi:hypothetical protein
MGSLSGVIFAVSDLGISDATTDEVYAAMDWLLSRQDAIETKLAAR